MAALFVKHLPHSRFPHHPASDPPEEARGRRALVEATARRVHVYRGSLRRAWKRLLTRYRRGPAAIKAKPTVRALMEPSCSLRLRTRAAVISASGPRPTSTEPNKPPG